MSELNAQFYFAWVNPGTAFNAGVHNVKDEQIISFKVEHREGEFASLQISIKNPRVSLLSASRKQWAWLSWDKGQGISPLFYGRLVGIPTDIHREAITLEFIARPTDYDARKLTLANTLKVFPYYDPVFFQEDQRATADVAWEARTEIWDINRVSHEVTSTDLLVGEDGLEDFAASEVPYDSVSINFDGTPIRTVQCTAQCSWSQVSARSGGLYLLPIGFTIDSYTGAGLVSTWPKPGDKLDGGWTAGAATFARTDIENVDSVSHNSTVTGDDGSTASVSSSFPAWGGNFLDPFEKGQKFETQHGASMTVGINGQQASASQSSSGFYIALHTVAAQLDFGYDVSRSRTESVAVTVQANVQPIITLPGEEEVTVLTLSLAPVDDLISGVAPIGDPQRRSYFQTARGLQSIEYMLMVCRAKIAIAARAVRVTFDCLFDRAVDLSLRKNARLFDSRIPGGHALGKIVSYSFEAQEGKIVGHVEIASCIGTGDEVTEEAGDPVYVDGYVDGYQQRTNDVHVVGPSAIGYSRNIGAITDDGIIFPIRSLPVRDFEIENPPAYASEPWMPNSVSPANLEELISKQAETNYTFIRVELPNLDAGPFQSNFNVTVTQLELPQQINLGD
jgi:hypothetical protein